MIHPAMPNGVVASNGFNPLTLSPVLWLDSTDAATLVASGNSLTAWMDKSGNNYHASQTTGANKPQTGTRTHNGLNVVDFNNANSQYMVTPAFSSALAQPNTIYCVGKYDVVSSYYLVDGISDSARHFLFQSSGNDAISAGTTLAGSASNANPHILGGFYNTTSSALRRDGIQIASGTAGTQNLTGLTIGARRFISNFLDGWIGVILVFDRLLNAEEIAYLEAGLSAQWGISV